MKVKIFKIKILFVRYLTLIIFILFISLIIFITNGYIEKGPINCILNNFKERGIYKETVSFQGQTMNLYLVNPEYDYEDIENPVFEKDDKGYYYIGGELDIILTNRNPLRREALAIVRDIGGFFSKEFYIGHATVNISKDGRTMIESVGNINEFYGVRKIENDWIKREINYENDAQTIIGLRVKGLSNDQKDGIINSLKEKVGLKYNMNFVIPKKNSYYCTDLITRTFKEYGVTLDYDSLYPTGSDLIISENTYPIFICERVEDGVFNIYYMGE